MDIARWLEGLGLEQYEHAFREGDVDAEVLPELTADDLIALGVTSIGHRRKLLAAIAALRPATPLAAEKTPRLTRVILERANINWPEPLCHPEGWAKRFLTGAAVA